MSESQSLHQAGVLWEILGCDDIMAGSARPGR